MIGRLTLSTARFVESARLEGSTGWRLIVVASLSNLVFKAGVVLVLGDRALFRRIALWFGIGAASACALLIGWP